MRWLETGVRPDGLFSPAVFGDLSLPQWRVQTSGPDELYAVREAGHQGPHTVRVEQLDLDRSRIPAAVRRALAGRRPAVVRT